MMISSWIRRHKFSLVVACLALAYAAHVASLLYRLAHPPHVPPGSKEKAIEPFWTAEQLVDYHVYMVPSSAASVFGRSGFVPKKKELLWSETEVGLWEERRVSMNVSLPERVRDNGTCTIVVAVTRTGFVPHERYAENLAANQDEGLIVLRFQQMTQFLPVQERPGRRLLDSSSNRNGDNDYNDNDGVPSVRSHWKPRLVIQPVNEFTRFPVNFREYETDVSIPLQISTKKPLRYFNMVHLDELWLTRDHYCPMNLSTTEYPLEVSIQPISLGWFLFSSQIHLSLQMLEPMFKGDNLGSAATEMQSETDMLRRMFTETDPVLLAVTFVVSFVHAILDILAFKNDVSFWKNRREGNAGISGRALLMNLFCEIIVTLYLYDNDASLLILVPNAASIVLSLWKVRKVFRVHIAFAGGFPKVTIGTPSKEDLRVSQYDAQATRYLSYALYPLVAAYGLYSLAYNEHRSWYSWLLSSLASGIYVFGFILMTPQLFINHRLKTVAHLPWRVFFYRTMNTLIDDLFAFVIRMPTMHRLSCFRDDVVFFIYLYQRWIYPVDKSRIDATADPAAISSSTSLDSDHDSKAHSE